YGHQYCCGTSSIRPRGGERPRGIDGGTQADLVKDQWICFRRDWRLCWGQKSESLGGRSGRARWRGGCLPCSSSANQGAVCLDCAKSSPSGEGTDPEKRSSPVGDRGGNARFGRSRTRDLYLRPQSLP